MEFHSGNVKNKSRHKQNKKKIDLVNVVYDEEFVSLLNSLSSNLKNFYTITLNIIKDLYNNSLVIDNNSIYSKCLINEINYNTKEKIKQLNDRIDTICNTKKFLEKNILLIDSNLNKFFNDSKKIFKNMKTIRNSKINYAIETSVNYDGHNSMTNLKTRFEKEDLLINKKEKENYYGNINNSLCNEKDNHLSCSRIYKRNQIFPISRKNSENNGRYNVTIISQKNNSHKTVRNKLFNKNKNNNKIDKLFSSTFRDTFSINNNNSTMKYSLESSPEFSRTKSSFNNFYINQNSNINLNNNNFNNNNNNNNLELSYKVIEFLSLLSKITKNKSKKNPLINNIIQKFEATKKNLFELSKKYIEQNNKSINNNNRIIQNYNNINPFNNKMSKTPKDLQLFLMNNNITNLRKEIEYKEFIDKINHLKTVINNLEKEKKQLLNINNNTKKQLINNNLLLSKKNSQIVFAKKEKNELINQINILQKDNGALMDLIHEKNSDINNNNNNTDIKENDINDVLLMEQKENIIIDLNKQIKALKNRYENKLKEKDNEIKIMNNKNYELNNSMKYYNNLKNIIKEKEDIINELKNNMASMGENDDNENRQNIKNELDYNKNKTELICEQLDIFSFYATPKIDIDNNNNNNNSSIVIKKEFDINELIFEQIDHFSFIKNINFNDENKSKEITNDLENEIKKLNEMINKKNNEIIKNKNEIEKNKNENSMLKKMLEENKNKRTEENEEKNKYIEEIKKLKKENKEIIEEKNDLSNDYENIFLNNKKMEITIASKEEDIQKKDNIIKELKEQIKELKNNKYDNYQDFDNDEAGDLNMNQKMKKNLLVKNNNNNFDIDAHNEIVSQLKDEIKEKENEIEYLKLENQELKNKIEEFEENYDNSSVRQNSDFNDKNNNFEEKIKFLTERNEYYQNLYSENNKKLQNLENLNKKLKIENEELKKNIQNNNDKNMSLRDKIIQKRENDEMEKNNKVSDSNIPDLDKFNEYQNNEEKDEEKDDEKNHKTNKNNNIINKGKEISFSSNANSFSFNNTEEINKNKNNNNNINHRNSKGDSIFTLGNNNNNNNMEDNNDNKLIEKLKVVLDKLSKMEDSYLKLQKKYMELKERVKKHNKNNINTIKITISDDGNDTSNGNDIELMENNFNGENDALSKLNMNKNLREQQEYIESILNELEATKNQLIMIKQVLKELEKKFDTIKQISENLFSKLTLKKKEKEEFSILLKVMDFTDEKISFILDKKKMK